MNLGIKSVGSYLKSKLSLRDPDGWEEKGMRSHTGEAVTAQAVNGLDTVWACVNLLAGTVGSLPLGVYQKTGRLLEPATDHPLYNVLGMSPNFDLSADEFIEFLGASIELRGNAYSEIKRNPSGAVIALDPIQPDTVTTRRNAKGQIEYRWIDESGKQRVEVDEKIWHIRGPFGTALGGKSAIQICKNTFGSAIAGEKAAGSVFRNGLATVGGVKMDKALNRKQRRELRENMREDYSGAKNAGTPMILDNGLDWVSISLSPEDLQLLSSRKYSVVQICRIFGVPPHLVQHTEGNTTLGTSITEQTLGFEKFSLRRRIKRIEGSAEKQLLTPAEYAAGFRIKFNLDGLLRADPKGRMDYYERGLRNGMFTINWTREKENLPPVPGGDQVRVQMQNVLLVDADGKITNPGDE